LGLALPFAASAMKNGCGAGSDGSVVSRFGRSMLAPAVCRKTMPARRGSPV